MGDCMLHNGYNIPSYIMDEVKSGNYFSDDKIEGLFNVPTFFAGCPVKVNGVTVATIFATTPIESSLKEYAGNIMSMYLSSALFAAALSFLVVYGFTLKKQERLQTNTTLNMRNVTRRVIS